MKVLTMKALTVYLVSTFLFCFSDAQNCDYYTDDPCINVQTEATAELEFKPLFTKNPTLVYAIDDLNSTEIETEKDKYGVSGNLYSGPIQNIAFWVEYSGLNYTPSAEHRTDVVVMFTNVTGATGGGNNGCDDLLGNQCSENLKEVLRWGSVSLGTLLYTPIQSTLDSLHNRPLRNLSCPDDLFDDSILSPSTFITETNSSASDYSGSYSPILASGNSSYVYGSTLRLRSYEEQLAKAAVGVFVRYPRPQLNYTTNKLNYGYNDVQLEIVCAKAQSASSTATSTSTGTSTTSSSTANSANAAAEAPGSLLIVLGMFGLATVMLELRFY